MRALALVGALVALLAVSSVASAAPPGKVPIEFRFNEGSFCGAGPCTPARASLEGYIKVTPQPGGGERIELSRLSGRLRIGVSPFAKTERKLQIDSPGPVRSADFEAHRLYDDCLVRETLEEFLAIDGEINGFYWSDGSFTNAVIGLKAGSSSGSGELAWWTQDFCQWREVEGGGIEKFTGDASGSNLNGQLVGPKLAGRLNLNGRYPVIGS